jgi:hypothetical protein
MSVQAYEGIVENGRIKLADDAVLPEHTRVYVVVSQWGDEAKARIYSPRLAHPEQAGEFAKQVIEMRDDAGI